MKNIIVNVRSTSPIKLMEDANGDSSEVRLSGEFTTFDVMNRNKRIYKKQNYLEVLEGIKDKCVEGALVGELGHPTDRMTTDLASVSHVVTKLEVDDKNNCVKGEIKLLDTPNGNIAKSLIKGGVPLFISSRAAGYVSEAGVVTLTNLITYDIVDEPGFANARLKVRSLTESLCGEDCDPNISICTVSPTDTPFAPAMPGVASANTNTQDEILSKLDTITSRLDVMDRRLQDAETAIARHRDHVHHDHCGDNSDGCCPTCNDWEAIVDEKINDVVDLIYAIENNNINDINEACSLANLLPEGSNKRLAVLEQKMDDVAAYLSDVVTPAVNNVIDNINEADNTSNAAIAKYLDEVVAPAINEMQKRDNSAIAKYLDEVVAPAINEINERHENATNENIAKYLDEVVAPAINEMQQGDNSAIAKYLDEVVAPAINEMQQGDNSAIAKYLDEVVAPAINEMQKCDNTSIAKYLDEVVAPAINEMQNNDGNQVAKYLDEIAVPTIKELQEDYEHFKAYVNDVIVEHLEMVEDKVHYLNEQAADSASYIDDLILTRKDQEKRLSKAVAEINEKADNLTRISPEDILKPIDQLLNAYNIKRDIVEQQEAVNKEKAALASTTPYIEKIMHPSVRHIWEALTEPERLRIMRNVEASMSLPIQGQTMMLSRSLRLMRPHMI